MLTFVNSMKVKWGAILQVISTVAKVLALIVIIITGLVKLGQGRSRVCFTTIDSCCNILASLICKKKKKIVSLKVSTRTLKIRLKAPS